MVGIEISQADIFSLFDLIQVLLKFVGLLAILFSCKINDILAVLPCIQLFPLQDLPQGALESCEFTHCSSALVKHRFPDSRCWRFQHFNHSRRKSEHLPAWAHGYFAIDSSIAISTALSTRTSISSSYRNFTAIFLAWMCAMNLPKTVRLSRSLESAWMWSLTKPSS